MAWRQYPPFMGSGQSKYRNKKVTYNGMEFDSIKERDRYFELQVLQRAGQIRNLRRQVSFELIPYQKLIVPAFGGGTRVQTEKAVKYIADFAYEDKSTGRTVVEDVKSPITRKQPEYVIKRKLLLERYHIAIKEV